MFVKIRRADRKFSVPFRIAYKVRTHAQCVILELDDGNFRGLGEALGVSYRGESADTLYQKLGELSAYLSGAPSRSDINARLEPGGVRNAVDCALWDLEAKRAGKRAWDIAGIQKISDLVTAITLGIDAPTAMAVAAQAYFRFSTLKIKLAGDAGDLERVQAVRSVRPDATLLVDANQAWSMEQLTSLTPKLGELGVRLIEQPLPIGQDAELSRFRSPVPLCADETCQTVRDLQDIAGRYQFVNIKLDKTGGLTHALELARAAKSLGLRLMVGSMGGSSLAMAPAFIVGQFCDYIDLDGPILLDQDVADGLPYDGERVGAPPVALWG